MCINVEAGEFLGLFRGRMGSRGIRAKQQPVKEWPSRKGQGCHTILGLAISMDNCGGGFSKLHTAPMHN